MLSLTKEVVRLKQRVIKSNTRFVVIAIASLLVLTMLILPAKEESRLKLKGSSHLVLSLNQEYQEQGITYKGEDVTDDVKIDNFVDTKKEGAYQIHYYYQTERGKTLSITRTVTVKK